MKSTSTTYRILGIASVALLSVAGGWLGSRLGDPGPDGSSSAPNTLEREEATVRRVALDREDVDAAELAGVFQQRFRDVARASLPVVVEINTVNTVTRPSGGNPLSRLFGQPDQGEQREYQQRGLGSGVLVAREGDRVFVVTNNHVAGEADEIEIVLNDGRSFSGELVGRDELLDLALVAFRTADDVPLAQLGSISDVEIGDWVFAVGNPLGFESSVTAGIVSAKERSVDARSGLSGVTSYIQTDAAINQGNSGGALVNINGEVVGINTWIASRSGGSDGIGFAIPVNMVQRAIEDFIERGEVAYSWLGVITGDANEVLLNDLDADGVEGAFVHGVFDDSPADRSGLRPGDIVTRVGDQPVRDSGELVRAIAARDPEETVEVEVHRLGASEILRVSTAVRDQDEGSRAQRLWPGLVVQPLSDQIRAQLDLNRRVDGVIVAGVTDDTPAAESGIRRGDVIVAVNGREIASVRDFYERIAAIDTREVQFRVRRGRNEVIAGFVRPD